MTRTRAAYSKVYILLQRSPWPCESVIEGGLIILQPRGMRTGVALLLIECRQNLLSSDRTSVRALQSFFFTSKAQIREVHKY